VSRYQKGKTNLDFTEARDSAWQWHQLGHMQVCTSLQTDNHASTTLLRFLQAGCRPTNSIKALKATMDNTHKNKRHKSNTNSVVPVEKKPTKQTQLEVDGKPMHLPEHSYMHIHMYAHMHRQPQNNASDPMRRMGGGVKIYTYQE